MSRINCRLSVAGFGSTTCTVTRITHGMSVVAYAGEGQSRRGKAFYSSKRTSGSFDLTVFSPSYRAHERLAEWLESYGRWVSDPANAGAPMRVTVPVRNFDSTAALRSGVTFGDGARDFTYSMDLSFVGARGPVELSDTVLSKFNLPKTTDPALVHLYPGGTQLSGTTRGWDTMFDDIGYDVTNGLLPGLMGLGR